MKRWIWSLVFFGMVAGAAFGISKQEVAERVIAGRPRLILPSKGWKEIEARIKTSDRHRAWYADVKRQADGLVEESNIKIGRNTQSDLMALALVYKVEGGTDYLDKVQDILVAAYEKPMWDKGWKLDQAMVSVGVAAAYDWLYDDLPRKLRRTTEQNLAEVSLACYLKSFDGGIWWVGSDRPGNIRYYNNHNGVCNGAALVVASALLDSDKFSGRAQEVVAKGLASLKVGTLDGLLPDGAWDEGSGYFGYGMTGMTLGLTSVRNSLGTLFGLLDHSGLGKTGAYLVATTGPTGTFNYADGTSRINPAYWMCWLAGATDDESLASAFRHLQGLENHRGSVLGLCWDDPAVRGGEFDFPLDASFGRIEVGALCSGWDDPLGAYVGFKFGRPRQSHAHSDVGTFVYDADGVRWALDLAGPPYLKDFFSYEDARYHFYRAKPEGHNTLVINPSDAYQQVIDSDSRIERIGEGLAEGDMTPAYVDQAKSVRRGFMLDRSTGAMLVQDELVLKQPSEVWWFMHTAAEVELKEGGETVVLSSNNKTVEMSVVVPEGIKQPMFIAEPAKPLPSSRVVKGEYPDLGKITRIALHFTGATKLRFAVSLRPGSSDASSFVPVLSEIPLALENITVTEGDAAVLLDGDWTTVWSANSYVEEDGVKRFVPQSIVIDLENPATVRAVGLGFDTAFQRRYDFNIHVSNDGKQWKQVFHGHSGKREGEQRFFFEPERVRFVKVEGLGNERCQNRFSALKLY